MKKKTTRRPLVLESLEGRQLLTANVLWANAGNLTVSFVPDGTDIGEHESSLFAKFGAANPAAWQEAILRGLQTWSQHTNVNFGLVSDSGAPLGARGTESGDLRFGDVRIGAVPMSAETLAVSVDYDQGVAGTWAGDWLFNELGDFSGDDALYKVALHEVGHILGLPHSTDPLSPMFRHSSNIAGQPTAADIAELQSRYGVRQTDRNDTGRNNDSLGTASRMLGSDDSGFPLETPLIEFGDLTTSGDVDIIKLPIPAGYQGKVTWQLRTREVSLLQPKLTVLNAAGAVLAQQTSTQLGGDVLAVSVNQVTPGTEYFARIERAGTPLFGVGAYALVATFDDRLTVDLGRLPEVVRRARQVTVVDATILDARDYRQLFLNNLDHPFDDDGHTDDGLNNARQLQPVVVTSRLVKFQAVASTTDGTDQDVFRIRVPDLRNFSEIFMHVTVESLQLDRAVHTVTVTDRNGQEIPVRVLGSGEGTSVLEVPFIESNREYYITVNSSGLGSANRIGNFRLSAILDETPTPRQQFAVGELSNLQPETEFTLYVGKSQLVSFTLESDIFPADDAAIWLTIYNSQQKPVHAVAATMGTTRSGPSVLLDPGEYRLQVGAKAFGTVPLTITPFTIWTQEVSDPIGPPVIDAGETPIYACSGIPDSFCYPGDIVTQEPMVLTTPSVFILPTLAPIVFSIPLHKWYWQVPVQRTNSLLRQDVNGDGEVAPLDALAIINDLNERGARAVPPPPVVIGYLDVNADGIITPLDVLAVINAINLGVR